MATLKTILITVCALLIYFSPPVAAATLIPNKESTPSVQMSPSLNSFEMFWPLVAGKTIEDGFVYQLKRFKETVRGWFIFGKVEKVDYSVFLATKRVLEAEKLINENKYGLANETLDDALSQLSIAEEKIQGFSRSENSSARNKEMAGRLSNIDELASLLASRESDSSGKLRTVADKASSIAKKLQD